MGYMVMDFVCKKGLLVDHFCFTYCIVYVYAYVYVYAMVSLAYVYVNYCCCSLRFD